MEKIKLPDERELALNSNIKPDVLNIYNDVFTYREAIDADIIIYNAINTLTEHKGIDFIELLKENMEFALNGNIDNDATPQDVVEIIQYYFTKYIKEYNKNNRSDDNGDN